MQNKECVFKKQKKTMKKTIVRSEIMAKYVKKPVEIEAITFDELMRIGAENADTVVNGMPVKFTYNGYAIRQ